jgi:hypothetical protein
VLIRFIGLGLFFFGFWFLGQNIIFSSQISFFTFRGIAAGGSIILLIAGISTYLFGSGSSRNAGLVMLLLAVVLIFMSGIVIITPTSLAEVGVGIAAMIFGGRMITSGRYDI